MLYVLPYNANPDGIGDVKELYEILKKLNVEANTHKATRIKIAAAGNIKHEYLKKCVEFVFRDTDTKMQVLVPKVGANRTRQQSVRSRENPQNDKIIVKSNGRQYADMLRAIKSSVNLDEVGVRVKTIKKTANGDVLLEVQGGKSKAELLKKEIQNRNQDTKVHIKDNNDIIHIMDIDGDVNEKEIETAVAARLRLKTEENIRVLSTRPTRYGGQTATVAVKKGLVTELIREGSIKIGWTTCRVRARVNILRCYKCLEFGHHSSICRGVDRSKQCLNCGKDNHKAKDCKNESHCNTCQTNGHRADQTKCPRYREMIKEKAKLVQLGGTVRNNSRHTESQYAK